MSLRLPEFLTPDCESCPGLCCAALPFARSADFAFDKSAGEPCSRLTEAFRCGIHGELRERGMKGCTVYECFGAGQKLAQFTYGGRSWRDNPEKREEMFAVFPVMQQLHEMLALLTEALWRSKDALAAEAAAERDRLARLTELPPAELLALPVAPLRAVVGDLLRRVSAAERARTAAAEHSPGGGPSQERRAAGARGAAGSAAREAAAQGRGPAAQGGGAGAGAPPGGAPAGGKRQRGRSRAGAGAGRDFVGAKLAAADLAGADLRGALLIAADLRGADLRSADLLGADLRDADLRGADLRGALFLTQPQLNAAVGDGAVRLPEHLRRPGHWV